MPYSKFTVQQVSDALTQTKGMVYLAAKRLGCTPQTIYNYLKRHPTLEQLHKDLSEEMVDVAELRFFRAIQQGEPWAIAMMLKTKGKKRGYVEKSELDVSGSLRVYRTPTKASTSQQWQDEVASNGHGS